MLDWKPLDDGWTCILCADSHKHTYTNTLWHEQSAFHRTLVEETARREREDEGEQATNTDKHTSTLPTDLATVDNATRNLLMSLAGPYSRVADSSTNLPERSPEPAQIPVEGWGLFEANEDTDLALSSEQQGIALIAKSLLDRFDEMSVGSADNDDERSEVDEADVPEPIVPGKCICSFSWKTSYNFWSDDNHAATSEPPLKRARNVRNDDSLDPSAKWFPWRDKIVSTFR
jgi:hypothetical protein